MLETRSHMGRREKMQARLLFGAMEHMGWGVLVESSANSVGRNDVWPWMTEIIITISTQWTIPSQSVNKNSLIKIHCQLCLAYLFALIYSQHFILFVSTLEVF